MKLHLSNGNQIDEFILKHARSKSSFERFREVVKNADWNSVNDLKQTFGAADVIDNNRVVFNIGGNNYRLICGFWFGPRMVHLYVKWIGAHAEYDKLCDQNLQFTIDSFS
jgi:mRNA interferase HigB